MKQLISILHASLWGAPVLILILGVGLYLTISLGAPQIVLFPRALKAFLARLVPGRKGEGSSSFRALCTALAATVGTGNLVGVAGAICLGGPGSIFWMWICGLLGMGLKYGEAALAVRFRVESPEGYAGGPMYVITRGLGSSFLPLARIYCLFGVIASFGVGNSAQVNAAVSGINQVLSCFGLPQTRGLNLVIGLVLSALIGSVLIGGARRIGAMAELVVPALAVCYILLCGGVLALRASCIPDAFRMIFQGAFSPRAVTGGMLGSAFTALRVGCSRGVFTNEAGMGTASIAHGSASVFHPAQQGLMGIMEVFLDTIVICTLTALVILVSGVPIPYGTDAGGKLTNEAFQTIYGGAAPVFMAIALVFFAVTAVLGWGLYGGRCAQFLFGPGAWRWFALSQTLAVLLGALADTSLVWQAAEILNGLMAIPNLIALAALTPDLRRLTIEFRKSGTDYADFH